jgi:hypothetical protein
VSLPGGEPMAVSWLMMLVLALVVLGLVLGVILAVAVVWGRRPKGGP